MKNEKNVLSVCLCLALVLSLLCVTGKGRIVYAASYGLNNPRTDSSGITTWDCIYFGSYWQNDTNGDGVADKKDIKQPIKWRVLSVSGNDAFLLADQNLDYLAYDDYDEYRDNITWEICTLRQWLNNDFYNNAFDGSEQNSVLTTEVINEDNPYFETLGGSNTSDKIYMLSLSEVWNPVYGFCGTDTYSETREAKNTAYVKECGAATVGSGSRAGNGRWWLRTPGACQYFAVTVLDNGDVAYAGSAVGTLHLPGAPESKYAVRPVLHLDLSTDKWSKADTVSAAITGRIEEDSVGAPEPDDEDKTLEPDDETGVDTIPPEVDMPEEKPDEEPKEEESGTINVSETTSQDEENTVKSKKINKVIIRLVKNKKGKKVILSWKKVKGINNYELQYADNKKFQKKKSKTTGKTKYIITKCRKNITYYIRVRAYKLDGTKRIYGNWGNVKKVKVKK